MLNVIALMGRLTADPELRHTQSNIAVTSFTLAVDRDYQKQGQDRQADFIDIVCWRGTAEFANKYFHKGQLIAVEGLLQTRSYTDSQGIKRKAVEVVAHQVHFAEPKKTSDSAAPAAPATPAPTQTAQNQDFVEIAGDDDLPF